jgi:DNA-binding MarR family transcriptional regulator
MENQSSNSILIEKFWESVPPAWRLTRSQIRRIAAENFQMTEEQFQVLRRIRRGSNSVSTLATISQTSRSAVSKAVDALVRKGYVKRSLDPNDRRNIPLSLTGTGQQVMDSIFTEAESWISGCFEQLAKDELESLLQGMELLRKAFLGTE